jgi:hypothetical protein
MGVGGWRVTLGELYPGVQMFQAGTKDLRDFGREEDLELLDRFEGQDFAELCSQGGQCKGLLQEGGVAFENAVVDDGLIGIAGHIKDFYSGADSGDALG